MPQPNRDSESRRPNRRHFKGEDGHHDNCTSETWDQSAGIQTKARCWAEGDYEGKAIGLRRGDQPAHEVSLEKTMDRKKRVPTIMDSRNGLQQMHNSDAANSNPEYLKYWIGPKYWAGQGFYWQQEGGCPSLEMRNREPNGGVHHCKTLEMTEEQLLWKAPKRATFKEKQEELERRAEMNAVSLLPKARKQNASAKYSGLHAHALGSADA